MNRLKVKRVRLWVTLGSALALGVAVMLVTAITASGGSSGIPGLKKVHVDPFADAVGYHESDEEPSIYAAKNPARAGAHLAKSSTIVATQQTGRVYDGGASDIGYEVSVNGGSTWKSGELPLTIQGGQANTCGGPLSRASDTVTVYDARYDVWLVSTLGLSQGANVPAVYINRGTANFTTKDIDWGPPICQHITQATSDSPDKNWITCDNWSTSKGYGNCYVEWDNNGNGNREIMQYSTDGGLTWIPGPNVSASSSGLPGNGNTGDVTGETTLVCPTAVTACATGGANAAFAGDTNIKVASVTGIGTTLAAASTAGATNIKVTAVTPFFTTTLAAASAAGDTVVKVASVAALAAGQVVNIDAGGLSETRTITSVGTAGATGTGVTLNSALSSAHASGVPLTPAGQQINVDPGAGNELATIQVVGTAGATGSGLTLTAPLANAHASGVQVNDAQMKVEVDFSGGNQEIVNVTNVGTAGAAGTGVSFSPALARNHWVGVHVAATTAPQAGHTGDIGGVPLVQPPPPGSAPGSTCGRVVTPLATNGVSWWSSNDCGAHFSAETQITPNMTATHTVPQMRTSLLPTSAMDGAGNIYVVWQTRSFRVGSTASTPNDIAMSVMPAPTAANPNPAFGAPVRIPIDLPNDNTNTRDHFIPGISADPNTSGSTAHLGLYFYSFPVANCAYADPANLSNQCDLQVGYVSSTDGGATWSSPTYLAHMTLNSLVRSSQGLMVGDYSSADVIPAGKNKGKSISGFAVGLPGLSDTQNLFVATHGLPIVGGGLRAVKASKSSILRARKQGSGKHPKVPPRG
ncbi:MAG: sialidase family protein [Gaiellaceae bacterium]